MYFKSAITLDIMGMTTDIGVISLLESSLRTCGLPALAHCAIFQVHKWFYVYIFNKHVHYYVYMCVSVC